VTAVSPITLETVNGMDRREFTEAFGAVFEHAPWIADGAYPVRPFVSLTALHRSMLAVLAAAPREKVIAFLNGHPDLAAPAARRAPLTEASEREQAGAGLGSLDAKAAARLARWNAQYRQRFGFPFIICAGRHDQISVFAELERRLAGDPEAEYQAALAEITTITALRLAALVRKPAALAKSSSVDRQY
jgi:2-oxo-4-hydroxy-4-carboxy-5-ureidoimidazoline decarboxylase